MEDYRRRIQAAVRRRDIQRLYHFTPIENLAGILTHGLASRRVLKENGIEFQPTDGWLADETDAVSLSIHSINVAMFDRKKKQRDGWAIVGIDASVLWTHACRFGWTNSASKEIMDHRAFRGGPFAFDRMFDDRPVSGIDDRSFRSVHQRGDHQPTDNAAEVEVLDPILPDLIVQVVVSDDSRKEAVEAFMAQNGIAKQVAIEGDLFL